MLGEVDICVGQWKQQWWVAHIDRNDKIILTNKQCEFPRAAVTNDHKLAA